jgi:hypothetical protein
MLLCYMHSKCKKNEKKKNEKKYYNKLKKTTKQKELGIVSSGTTGLTLRNEIAPKNTLVRLLLQSDYESNFNKKSFLNFL